MKTQSATIANNETIYTGITAVIFNDAAGNIIKSHTFETPVNSSDRQFGVVVPMDGFTAATLFFEDGTEKGLTADQLGY